MDVSWEVERSTDPQLRWVCGNCFLLNVEHPKGPWWGCADRWTQGRR